MPDDPGFSRRVAFAATPPTTRIPPTATHTSKGYPTGAAGHRERLGAWPTTRLATPWWETVPVWMPFLGTERDGQAF